MMHKSNQVGKRGNVSVQEMFSVWYLMVGAHQYRFSKTIEHYSTISKF